MILALSYGDGARHAVAAKRATLLMLIPNCCQARDAMH
jgi:hypothetical protein